MKNKIKKIITPEVKKLVPVDKSIEAKALVKQGLNAKEVAKVLNIDKYEASKLIKQVNKLGGK